MTTANYPKPRTPDNLSPSHVQPASLKPSKCITPHKYRKFYKISISILSLGQHAISGYEYCKSNAHRIYYFVIIIPVFY